MQRRTDDTERARREVSAENLPLAVGTTVAFGARRRSIRMELVGEIIAGVISLFFTAYFTKRLTVNYEARRNPYPGWKEAIVATALIVVVRTIVAVASQSGVLAFFAGLVAAVVVYSSIYRMTVGGAVGLTLLVTALLSLVSFLTIMVLSVVVGATS
jgi:hypothetical protein